MNKLLIAAITIGLCSQVAQAETVLYGKIHASYGATSSTKAGVKTSNSALGDAGSRLGLKGATPIGDGLEGIYALEMGVNLDGEDRNSKYEDKVLLDNRQRWVGIRGSFGEVRAGNQYMPNKVVTSPIDLFADQYGDYNSVLSHETTAKNAVSYLNRFGKVGIALSHGVDESADEKNTTGIMFNYREKGVYAGLALESQKDEYNDARLALGYKFPKGHKVGVAYQNHKDKDGVDDEGFSAALISGGYKIGDAMLKAQVGQRKTKGSVNDTKDLVALGVDYNLSKRTKIYFEHSQIQDDIGQAALKGNGTDAGDEAKATAIGIMHSF